MIGIYTFVVLVLSWSRHEVNGGRGFVVVTTQRSGSTWLLSRLANLAEAGAAIRIGNELPSRAFIVANASRTAPTPEKWPGVIDAVLSELGCVDSNHSKKNALFRQEDAKTCGFKIMYFQIHEDIRRMELMHSLLLSKKVKIVHLMRKSHVRRELSRWRARATGVWHGANHQSLCVKHIHTLTPQRLVTNVIKSATRIALYRDLFSRSDYNHFIHTLVYEDLLPSAKEPNRTFEALVTFINPQLLPYMYAVAPLTTFSTTHASPCFDACLLGSGSSNAKTPDYFLSALHEATAAFEMHLRQFTLSSPQYGLALADFSFAIRDCE